MTNPRLLKMLELARSSEHDGERLTAFSKAVEALEGKTFADLFAASPTQSAMTSIRMHQQINDLKHEIEKRDIIIKSLRAEMAIHEKVSVSAPTGFARFREAVQAALKMDHGWQTKFCETTGFAMSDIQQWRKKDAAPKEAFDAIAALRPSTKRKSLSWSDDDYAELDRLVRKGLTNKQIADEMTVWFNTSVNENMIKGAKDRLVKVVRVRFKQTPVAA